VTLAQARAFWQRQQGLAEPPGGSLGAVIAATGWARTLGGAEVYLAVGARAPQMAPADLEAAVARSEVQVVPAVRGCIYLVPRVHVPLTLRVAEEKAAPAQARDMERAGIERREVDELGAAVRQLLGAGPLGTDGIRRGLPAGAVRSLGERGKKVGVSSPLPLALRQLELRGDIERTLEGGKLDSERYLWRRTAKSPFDGARVPADAAGRHAELARLFFGWAGPATMEHFQCWTVLSQRDCRAAIAAAGLVPVTVEGWDDTAWLRPEHVEEVAAARAAETVSLLPFEDNFVVLRDAASIVSPRHHARKVPVWGKSGTATLGTVKHISLRPVCIAGELAGFWDMDMDEGEVVYACFDALPPKRTRAVAVAAERARAMFGAIGHARSFSLDTDDTVRERVALVRKMARR
jgi:winged helix DNA-binding protein